MLICDWPHLDPSRGLQGVQTSKKWQNCVFSGSLHWSNSGWKRSKLLCIFLCQAQNFPKIPYNWENWENFTNYYSRNFLMWFSNSWENFEWNFGANHFLLLLVFLGSQKTSITTKNAFTLQIMLFNKSCYILEALFISAQHFLSFVVFQARPF